MAMRAEKVKTAEQTQLNIESPNGWDAPSPPIGDVVCAFGTGSDALHHGLVRLSASTFADRGDSFINDPMNHEQNGTREIRRAPLAHVASAVLCALTLVACAQGAEEDLASAEGTSYEASVPGDGGSTPGKCSGPFLVIGCPPVYAVPLDGGDDTTVATEPPDSSTVIPDSGSTTPDSALPTTPAVDAGTPDTGSTSYTGGYGTSKSDSGTVKSDSGTGKLDTGSTLSDTGTRTFDSGPADTGPVDTGTLDTGITSTDTGASLDTAVDDAADSATEAGLDALTDGDADTD
jgi:hypothetical protein